MKGLCLLVFSMVLLGTAQGQDLVVRQGSNELPARQIGAEKIWFLQMDGEDYYIISRSDVDSLAKKVLLQGVIIERHETVLAAKDSLLAKYEAYERAATAHVDTLEALALVADSLYTGYKDLYTDFKRLIGLSTFSVSPGIGLTDLPGNETRVIGVLGLGYHRWWAQFQVGQNYKGVVVGYRLPFGF